MCRWYALYFPLVLPFQVWCTHCPGSFNMPGYGNVSLTNAMWNIPQMPAGPVAMLANDVIAPSMFGRTYFSDACSVDGYDHLSYASVNLLGKTFKYTTDVAGAGCGCNAALYLTSLHQNSMESLCSDFYCDANRVCGVACAEIDLQEANQYAWHSTLHVPDDGNGIGLGYGGGESWNGHRDWDSSHYGPGGRCIDTQFPFDVAVSFPINGANVLQGMEVHLSQAGKACNIKRMVESYDFSGRNGMAELTAVLRNGVTPIISYWKADNMLWMDGPGADGKGPCGNAEHYGVCDAASVKFYSFAVEEYQSRRLQPDFFV